METPCVGQLVSTLVLDDSEDDIFAMRHLLKQYGGAEFEVCAETQPIEALRDLEELQFDVLLLDYSMPGTNGVDFLREATKLSDPPPIIVVTGQSDYHLVALAIQAGACDCLNKQDLTAGSLGDAISRALISAKEAERVRVHEGLLIERLAQAATLLEPTISAKGVVQSSLVLGRALCLRERDLELLRYGALVHDVGKLGIEEGILNKAGALADEEIAAVQVHPLVGARLCGALSIAKGIAPVVRHHHEWWDGSGYPDRLAGEDIPYLARIVSIADSFDAMATNRPYRAALDMARIPREFKAGAGKQWDPRMVEVFLEVHPLLQKLAA